jgi:uncharacterized protein YvpB
MFKYILLFISMLLSCAETTLNENDIKDFRSKTYEEKKYSGSYCSENCIWSKYAVNLNAQEASANCVEGPCACVENVNIYQLCDTNNTPDIDENVQVNTNIDSNKNVPYYNQYDNVNYGWATCQNTSVAMVLSYYDRAIHPDTIYNDWGKDIAQSPSGLNKVYRYYSNRSVINTYTNATPEDLRNYLQQGYIVIVHGYFTSYGHVLVVKSYDGEYYYVNDPAGIWKGCFKCGYSNYSDGITKYKKQEFESAVFTSNGYSYLPGWIHTIK